MWRSVRTLFAGVVAVVALIATEADADTIVIRDSTVSGGAWADILNDFYSGDGHTSSIEAAFTASNTAGADLLLLPAPVTALSGAEIDAIVDHLAAGHRVAIFGDYAAWSGLLVSTINATLNSLGSAYSQTSFSFIQGGSATPSNGQLPAHPLTAGIASIFFSAFGSIAGVGAGEAFLLAPDLSTVIGAEEHLGGGSLVLALDMSLTGSSPFLGNLLGPVTGTPIPEPGTLGLLVAAAGSGIALRRRRRRA